MTFQYRAEDGSLCLVLALASLSFFHNGRRCGNAYASAPVCACVRLCGYVTELRAGFALTGGCAGWTRSRRHEWSGRARATECCHAPAPAPRVPLPPPPRARAPPPSASHLNPPRLIIHFHETVSRWFFPRGGGFWSTSRLRQTCDVTKYCDIVELCHYS